MGETFSDQHNQIFAVQDSTKRQEILTSFEENSKKATEHFSKFADRPERWNQASNDAKEAVKGIYSDIGIEVDDEEFPEILVIPSHKAHEALDSYFQFEDFDWSKVGGLHLQEERLILVMNYYDSGLIEEKILHEHFHASGKNITNHLLNTDGDIYRSYRTGLKSVNFNGQDSGTALEEGINLFSTFNIVAFDETEYGHDLRLKFQQSRFDSIGGESKRYAIKSGIYYQELSPEDTIRALERDRDKTGKQLYCYDLIKLLVTRGGEDMRQDLLIARRDVTKRKALFDRIETLLDKDLAVRVFSVPYESQDIQDLVKDVESFISEQQDLPTNQD